MGHKESDGYERQQEVIGGADPGSVIGNDGTASNSKGPGGRGFAFALSGEGQEALKRLFCLGELGGEQGVLAWRHGRLVVIQCATRLLDSGLEFGDFRLRGQLCMGFGGCQKEQQGGEEADRSTGQEQERACVV